VTAPDLVIRPVTPEDDFDAQVDLGQRAFGIYSPAQRANWLYAARLRARHGMFLCGGLNESMTQQSTMRTKAQVTRFFDGLRLVDPGVVLTREWRPDSGEESAAPGVLWAGVAGKP